MKGELWRDSTKLIDLKHHNRLISLTTERYEKGLSHMHGWLISLLWQRTRTVVFDYVVLMRRVNVRLIYDFSHLPVQMRWDWHLIDDDCDHDVVTDLHWWCWWLLWFHRQPHWCTPPWWSIAGCEIWPTHYPSSLCGTLGMDFVDRPLNEANH